MTWIEILVPLVGGVGLGLVYFLGLWFTLHWFLHHAFRTVIVIGSFAIRAGIVISGFFLLMQDDWKRLLMAVGGFIMTRVVLVRLLGPGEEIGSETIPFTGEER